MQHDIDVLQARTFNYGSLNPGMFPQQVKLLYKRFI